MPKLTNLKKTEHILGGGLRADGTHAEDIILRPGGSIELSDAEFKRHDSAPLRAMLSAGDLSLDAPAPKKAEPAKTSNAPARDADAEAETAELLKNVAKARK
jgi:hypothetical protein